MATTSFSNTSVTYKSDGVTIDIVADTVIDMNPPSGYSGTQDEFLAECLPPRFRMFAEYFASLTNAERLAQELGTSNQPGIDAGSLAFIDYVNEEIYQIFRGEGITIAGSGAVCSYTRLSAYAASGGGVHAGGSAFTIGVIVAPAGTAAITLSGTVVRVVDRIVSTSGTGTLSGAMAAAAVDRIVSTSGTGTLSGDATCTSIPNAPTGTGLAIGNTELILTWTDVAPAATGYKVFWLACPLGTENAAAIEAGTEWVGAKSPAGTTITGLLNGTQYGVIVAGTNTCTIPAVGAYNYGTVKYQTPSA
jgi:hypothetical protein